MKIEDFKIQWFPGHMTKAKRMMESQITYQAVQASALLPFSIQSPRRGSPYPQIFRG